MNKLNPATREALDDLASVSAVSEVTPVRLGRWIEAAKQATAPDVEARSSTRTRPDITAKED